MSFHLRSRSHKGKEKSKDVRPPPRYDDQFYDVNEGDTVSITDSLSSSFRSDAEKQVYEEHLAQIQEQLVSAMIENQNLAQELKQYKENAMNEKIRNELELEKKKTKSLQDQLSRRSPIADHRDTNSAKDSPVDQRQRGEVLPVETQASQSRTRLDLFWERTLELLYDVFEDFNEMTQPEDKNDLPEEPLKVKTLKENIKRFKTAIKPITDTVKGLQSLVSWKSPSYTLIVFIIFMYSVWKGWFPPLLFFLGALRMVVSFLHFKGYTFRFAYLEPGEPEKETDDSLGLSEKFNLVLQVATKVQNGLGSVADSLERVKNLLTWKHAQGSKRVLTIMCVGCVATAIIPTAILWRFIGIGMGMKIFLVNYVYNRYPRIKKRYDSNYRLWQTLPTDAEYDRNYVKAEMDKYIVVPMAESELERTIDGQLSDSSSSSEDEDSAEFRQVFSLPVTECPLRGWLRGKRAVIIGRDRSVFTLLSRKRGKLFLTNSFLCFEREKCPSTKNIVIPLQDICSVDKVKINQRMPGKGMSIQICINSEGRENVLLFGGIIGREDVVKSIEQASRNAKQKRQTSPLNRSSDSISRRSSSESTSSRIQNFTFGAYYVDSD